MKFFLSLSEAATTMIFVATNTYFVCICRNKTYVCIFSWSCHKHDFCCDKHVFVATEHVSVPTKRVFVAIKIVVVAAAAEDSCCFLLVTRRGTPCSISDFSGQLWSSKFWEKKEERVWLFWFHLRLFWGDMLKLCFSLCHSSRLTFSVSFVPHVK